MAEDGDRYATLKEKAIEEFKAYWVIVIYLALFLGALTTYRRLILAEFGVTYIHYGAAIIEALIIGKVILIGRAFSFSRWFEDRPLLVPAAFKSVLFGVLVFAFGILERLVEGWVHKDGFKAVVDRFVELGAYELCARVVMLILAFVPFFAFWELGRVLGFRRLAEMFLSKVEAEGDGAAKTR